MDIRWFEKFINMYFSGDYERAYQWKYGNIPQKLYKFEPFKGERISTVINNKLWFSVPKDMNDPFDSRGVCWDYQKVEELLQSYIPEERLKEKFEKNSIDDIMNEFISSARDNIKITCFSEELYSMPMWAHYAENHTGFCIEYDFKRLDNNHDLTKYLYPVGYEANRYDITNLFEMVLRSDYKDPRIKLLFFLMNIKHNSWSYEKEWRIINLREPSPIIEQFTGGNVDCPIKPSAIYLGIYFDNNEINNIRDAFSKENVPVYKLNTGNSKFFNLNVQEL